MDFKEYPKTRFAIYALSIAAALAATFVAVESVEYGQAFDRAANLLAAAAGATALAKLSPKSKTTPTLQPVDDFPDLEVHEYGRETEWEPSDFDEEDEVVLDGSDDPDVWTGPQNGDSEPAGRYGNHGL